MIKANTTRKTLKWMTTCETFIAVFDMQYLQVQVGSKKLQQFGSGACILHNYLIYFYQLLCFQELSMTESHSQNSALNSIVKHLQIA